MESEGKNLTLSAADAFDLVREQRGQGEMLTDKEGEKGPNSC